VVPLLSVALSNAGLWLAISSCSTTVPCRCLIDQPLVVGHRGGIHPVEAHGENLPAWEADHSGRLPDARDAARREACHPVACRHGGDGRTAVRPSGRSGQAACSRRAVAQAAPIPLRWAAPAALAEGVPACRIALVLGLRPPAREFPWASICYRRPALRAGTAAVSR